MTLGSTADLLDPCPGFRVRHIMTPKEEFRCVAASSNCNQVRKAAGPDFDCLPLCNGFRNVVGFVKVADLPKGGGPIPEECVRRLLPEFTMDADAPLERAIGWLAQAPFQLVLSRKKVVGLATASDLKKVPVLTVLFVRLAELEMLLSRLIQNTYQNNEWRKYLDEKGKKRLDDRLDSARRDDLSVDPIHEVLLEDIADVVLGSEKLRRVLGLGSDGNSRDEVRLVVGLRNRVDHPTKPLLDRRYPVHRLAEAEQALERLLDRARQATGMSQVLPSDKHKT